MATVDSGSQVSQHQVNFNKLKDVCVELLLAIGENPEREGLKDTPRRFANYWREFIDYQPGNLNTTFETITTNQIVTVSEIKVWSLCEHHLLPFWCKISIAYIPKDQVLGLSKFARIVQKYAHRLQLQEQLVNQIANEICQVTKSNDLMVIGQGEHLCMIMRGIKCSAKMSTVVTMGQFEKTELFEKVLKIFD